MAIKAQDLLVLYKRVANPKLSMTYSQFGQDLGLSSSQVHRAVHRSIESGFVIEKKRGQWEVISTALLEFSIHGVRYVFPTKLGPIKRGIPTSHSGPPLQPEILSTTADMVVWPYPKGSHKGSSIAPLCSQALDAARKDQALYEILCLIDALRIGRARERKLAVTQLEKRFLDSSDVN